ncbi:MAG: hypothetical protein ACFFDH_13825 [Promethearchaeota archaeon]
MLKRKRQRLNLLFGFFFISLIIAFILNMIYAPIPPGSVITDTIILILYFLTYFFLCFGIVFILIVHMIIVESTVIYSIKRQNRYILFYGLILFIGMLILVIIGLVLREPGSDRPLYGVDPDPLQGYVPQWGPVFLAYVLSIVSIFTIIPIIRTSLKIYSSIKTKALKRKWLYYFIGSLGLIFVYYIMMIDNLGPELLGDNFRLITSVLGVTVIIWGYLMYYGIGFKLKQ